MIRTFTHALRALRRAPGFAVTSVLLIGLSVGGVTTIAGAAYAVLMRPLRGVASTDGLVWLTISSPRLARPQGLSFPDFVDYRDAGISVMDGSAAYEVMPISLAGEGDPVRITGHLVAGAYFRLFGVSPTLGRFFEPVELEPGADIPVVVIGQELWRGRFAKDPSIAGKVVVVNGRPFTVIGVAPPEFAGPELGAAADLWLPAGALRLASPNRGAALLRRDRSSLTMVARLAPDVSPEVAQQVLGRTADRLSAEFPNSHEGRTIQVSRLRGGLPPGSMNEAVPVATLLVALAALVLVIAYTNLAGLQLARGLQRSREAAIHLAIGAGRARLFQQVLAEGVVLALVGGLLGSLFAMWLVDLIAIGGSQFRGLATTPEPWLAVASIGLALATGLVFGAAPAWITARRDVTEVLKESSLNTTSGRRRLRLQSAFVVAQIAMSLVLLFAATQFVRAIRDAGTTDLGFDADAVTALSFDLALQNYTDERRALFERDVRARAAALPGVSAAALVATAPLSGVMIIDDVAPTGAPEPTSRSIGMNGISPGFFETLRIPLRRGRPFSDADRQGATPVGILNETAARQLWPTRDAVGQFVRIGTARDPIEIVGVAADSKYDEPTEGPMPFAYVPLAQRHVIERATLLVRSASESPVSVRAIGDLVHQLDPALPVFEGMTMRDVARARLDRQSAISGLLSVLGIAGLIIATVGLYGVMAYMVTQRTREIGVRMALGSTPQQVLGLIVVGGLKLIAVGVAVGAIGALPVAFLLSREVFGLRVGDAGSFLGAALMLAVVATTAAYLPGRRAAHIRPLDALRAE